MTGRHNAITDVPGVEVGYATLIEGTGARNRGAGPIRTGVTVVLPKGKTDASYNACYFIVLQLVIGTSAVVAAIGLVKRARWAAPSVAIWGAATAALLAVQPLFEPMAPDAQRSIWLGAARVGVVAAGVSWFARRLGRGDAASRA